MTDKEFAEALAFEINEGLGSRLTVRVFPAAPGEDEGTVTVSDPDRDALISIDASIWQRIVRAVDAKLEA